MKFIRPFAIASVLLAVTVTGMYGCAGNRASVQDEEISIESIIIEETPESAIEDVADAVAESLTADVVLVEDEESSIESIIEDVEGVVDAFTGEVSEALAETVPAPKGSGVTLRVLVLQKQKRLYIEGAFGEKPSIKITPADDDGVLVDGEWARLPLSFTPEGELIRINGRPYRGRIEVFPDRGALKVVDELDLETYLAGLINYEISAKWPSDAVKTQAVIARTYALYQKRKSKGGDYHIEGSTLGQVYKGVNTEDMASLKAVNDTRGQVLIYRGALALTVYHSNAGGRTDASADVWSGEYSYLRSVRSPYDAVSPDYSWNFTMPGPVLGGLLVRGGYNIGSPTSIKVKARTPGGRARQVRVRDSGGRVIELEAEKFRKIIGYSSLRSTKFKVRRRGDLFEFNGKGSGHGVGLSQWGAKGMAENGYSYRQILRHYYPGTKLKRVY